MKLILLVVPGAVVIDCSSNGPWKALSVNQAKINVFLANMYTLDRICPSMERIIMIIFIKSKRTTHFEIHVFAVAIPHYGHVMTILPHKVKTQYVQISNITDTS